MTDKQERRIEAVIGKRAAEIMNAGADGTIYALFSEAAYCSIENGEILMLYDSRYGGISFGIGFADAGRLLHAADIAPGTKLVLNDKGIYVPDTGWYLKFYQKEEPLPPLFPQDSHRMLCSSELLAELMMESEHGIANDLWVLWHSSNIKEVGHASSNRNINIFAQKAEFPVSKLLTACTQCDKQGIYTAIGGLLGLGPGLTPSFDDWLTGFQYTLRFFSVHYGVLTTCAFMLGEVINTECPSKTSAISGAYLKAAAKDGEIFLLESLLRYTLMPDGEHELKKIAIKLLQVGSNSGVDMMTGVLFGLDFYLKNI